MRVLRATLAALAMLAAPLLHAQERTLLWKALDVKAKLENDGTLRISERHRMRFDGEWNGGERVFRVEPGQQLTLLGMSRVDRQGKAHAMPEERGEGIRLNRYRFDGTTLRWRAREASDPPFRNAERIYVIDYTLRNVVQRTEEGYVLAHDFAFADRPGPIESYSAELELDTAWEGPPDLVPRFERADLPPGEGATLTVQLQWKGEGQPEFVVPLPPKAPPPAQNVVTPPRGVEPLPLPPPPAPMSAKLFALGAFFVVATLMTMHFLRREEALGRFEPAPHVTPAWLEENLLVHRAEVVGAAWDGATGPGEVAALIAIMTAEGKIENVAGAPRLRLLVPRSSLSNYERGFVDALFINGNEIDPETLRRHYRETGFNPASTIAGPLRAAAERLVGSAPHASWAAGCLAFFAAGLVFPLMAIGFVAALFLSASYRNNFRGRGLAGAIPIPLLLAASLQTFINDSLVWLIANLIAGAVLLWVALRFAEWKESGFELQNLRNFLAAREFLRQRIVQYDPEVDPRWIPYMLAFGLVPDDRWSVAAAVRYEPVNEVWYEEERRRDETPAERWTPSSPTVVRGGGGIGSVSDGVGGGRPAPPSFQAGGGRFGGAGATGSWASIQTFANAVAATPTRPVYASSPSRSSSSRTSGSGWSWSSGGSSSSSSSSSRSSSSGSSRSSSSSGSRSSGGSSGGSRSGGGGSRSGGGGGGGW